MPIPAETLEIDAQGREGIVLDLALPVLAVWSKSVRVQGFRSSMGVSGLWPREVARLKTLSLATASKATGIFEGANDFRLGFPHGPAVVPEPSALGVEADYGTVEPGKVADLVVVRGHPQADIRRLRDVTHVIKMGQVHRVSRRRLNNP